MWKWLGLVVLVVACKGPSTVGEQAADADNTPGDARVPRSASRYRSLTFEYRTIDAENETRAAGIQGKLIRASDGTLLYAFFKHDGYDAQCNIARFAGGKPAPNDMYTLKLGVLAPGATAWSVEVVPLSQVGPNYATDQFGIDGTLDTNGDLVLALAAGPPSDSLGMCGSGDLTLARRTPGGTWTVTRPVTNSAACCTPCGTLDEGCTAGQDVGMWAAVAVDPNGALAVAFADHHNYWDQDGQNHTDSEFWHEATDAVTAISLFNGAGNNTDLIYAGPTAIVAYSQFNGSDLVVARRTGAPGSATEWTRTTVRPDAIVGPRIQMAQAANGTIGLVFHELDSATTPGANDVLLCESSDGGATWGECEQVYDELRNLQFPSLAYDADNRPLVAMRDCGATAVCSGDEDGVTLAWRNNQGVWEGVEVIREMSNNEGSHVSLVLDPQTDEPWIAFQDRTRGAARIAKGSLP